MATQLIQLQDVERLSASVIRVLGGNPGKVSSSVLDIAFQPKFLLQEGIMYDSDVILKS